MKAENEHEFSAETPKPGVFLYLIVMAGLPGTGKSALARALVKELGAIVLNKDVLREVMFSREKVKYSTQQDDLVVAYMLKQAAQILDTGKTVILDGRPFSRKYQIEEVSKFADKMCVPLRMVLCTCPEETAIERIESSVGKHPAMNRNAELYQQLKHEFEPIQIEHLEVDTSQSLQNCLEKCLSRI
jgi:predicted kinase